MVWWHEGSSFSCEARVPNEAIVGFNNVLPKDGLWRLPEEKVDKWSATIDSVIEEAAGHPRSYVDMDSVRSLSDRSLFLGRFLRLLSRPRASALNSFL